ncbi:hypothetical protein AURDEDRAFT_181611 [Auricularia subglabra TFB-10046 SS5]|nr:hypothetical protein AURDEDRAFT_181611 [Auricularia subglabra TFB-10046 SS5]
MSRIVRATLTLPELEVLCISLEVETRTTQLFSALRLPKLASLALDNSLGFNLAQQPDSQSDEVATMLRTLIDTSNPPLRHLCLHAFVIDDDPMISILRRLPLLERLVLTNLPLSSFFLAEFVPWRESSDSTWICPRLTHLCIWSTRDGQYHTYVITDDATRLIDARAAEADRTGGAVTKLTHVRVDDASMTTVNGRLCWIVDEGRDGTKHPDIFRDAYLPVDRWWRMDHHVVGSELVGL